MAKPSSALLLIRAGKEQVDLPQIASHGTSPSLSGPALKHLLINGLTRGTLVETCGARSSGKSCLCMRILASATQKGETCAVVDFAHSFHPDSAFGLRRSIGESTLDSLEV